MLSEILNSVILFGGGLALLLAFVQLFHDRSIFKNILLFVIFLTLGIIHFHVYITSATPGFNSNIASDIFLISKYLLGPSMYILFLAVFRKDFIFYYELFLHFVPVTFAILFVIVDIYGIKNPQGLVSSIRFYLLKNSLPEHLHTLGFALLFVYICAIGLRFDISILKREKSNRLFIIGFTVVVMLFAVIVLLILGIFTGSFLWTRLALTLTTFFFIYWFVIVQIYPEIFSSSIKKKKASSRNGDLLHGLDLDLIEKRLCQLMEQEKLFCDEDISIKRLADLISIQPAQFSYYLNHKLGINFNNFINRYRVNEAIEMMKQDNDRSLLDIAFSAGFNSKSAFYEAFTKETGMSPAKYRRKFFPKKKS